MGDISDLCREIIETKLNRHLEPHEGATFGSSAKIFSAGLYRNLCSHFRISTLTIDENESRMRFVTFVDVDTKEDYPFYRGDRTRVSIEMDNRTEILKFLYEYGPLYMVSGTKKTRSTIDDAYKRASSGVQRVVMGALAISASFTFDTWYLDEAALGVGSLLVLANLKNVGRYLAYKRKRG